MTQPTPPVVEALQIVGEILVAQASLGLTNGQIMFTNQKWKIPANQGLYVAIGYVGPGKVISNSNVCESVVGGMQENQSMLMLYQVQIDLLSFDSSARVLKELAYMALKSVASQQIQEKYNVQLGRNPAPFQESPTLEETAQLNRYVTTVALTQLITNTVIDTPYYDDFSQAVPPTIADEE